MSEYSSSDHYAGVDIRDAKAAFDDVALALLQGRRRYSLGDEGWYESSTDSMIEENGERTSMRARVQIDPVQLSASCVALFEQNERQVSGMDSDTRYILSESIAENVSDNCWLLLSQLIANGATDVRVQTLVQTSYEFAAGEVPIKRMTGSVGIIDATGAKYIFDDVIQDSSPDDEMFDQIKRDMSTLTPEDLATIRNVLHLFE